MEHSYCPFDQKDCCSECSLYLGEKDWIDSPCSLAHLAARADDDIRMDYSWDNAESLRKMAHALESIAKHFDPEFAPYEKED